VKYAERWLRTHACLPPDAPSPLPMADVTSGTTPKGLVTMVLGMGNDPLSDRGSRDDRERRIALVGPHLRCFGIALDEFHHTYEHRNSSDVGKLKSVLKTIVNSVSRPIIVMGTEGLDAYLDDRDELRNRFRRRVYLRDPKVTSIEDMRDIQAVLKAMKAVTPCAPDCDIDGLEMMLRLLLAADSQFGGVVDLVRRACLIGAERRAAHLQLLHLREAYRESARLSDRVDERNPFLMLLEVVKSLLAQLRTPVPVPE
jgi:hypothetical protein